MHPTGLWATSSFTPGEGGFWNMPDRSAPVNELTLPILGGGCSEPTGRGIKISIEWFDQKTSGTFKALYEFHLLYERGWRRLQAFSIKSYDHDAELPFRHCHAGEHGSWPLNVTGTAEKSKLFGDSEMNAELCDKGIVADARGETERRWRVWRRSLKWCGFDGSSCCFLGEALLFLNGDYVSSKEESEMGWWKTRRTWEADYDDLLQEEFERVDVLLAMMFAWQNNFVRKTAWTKRICI